MEDPVDNGENSQDKKRKKFRSDDYYITLLAEHFMESALWKNVEKY